MMHEVKDALRLILPQAVARVVESYEAFSSMNMPYEAKEFAAHHAACKAALAHLDSLMKMIKTIQITNGESDATADGLAQMIDTVRADLDDGASEHE